jgi:hypothetical protein
MEIEYCFEHLHNILGQTEERKLSVTLKRV